MGDKRLQSTRRTVLKTGGLLLASSSIATTAQATPGNGNGRTPNARFNLDFSDPSDAADVTSTSPGWVTDRRAPEKFVTTNDGRLRINIDETAETSGFYAYQGRKFHDAGGEYWFAGDGSTVFSYDFYIDPAWEDDDNPQETGVWPVLGDADGNISAYPILAYQDSTASDTGEAQFRTYVYEADENGDFESAGWVNLGLPRKLGIDPEEGGWVHVEAQLHDDSDGSALKWRVNNKLVYDARGYNVFSPSTQFLEFIINSINFGNDEDYMYDNLVLTEPGTAGN